MRGIWLACLMLFRGKKGNQAMGFKGLGQQLTAISPLLSVGLCSRGSSTGATSS